MLVLLTKLVSPEMVGQFALGLAITAPVIMFAKLKTRIVQATDARREYLFGDYLGLRLITMALALLVIAGIVLVAGYRWEMALIILTVGVAKAFEAISDAFYGLLQQHERMDRIAKSQMIKGPLSLMALGAGVYLTGNVLWGVVGLVLASALILMGYDVRSGAFILKPSAVAGVLPPDAGAPRELLCPRWERRALAKLAWLALPLGVVMALGSLRTNIPRYFVEHYLGECELGIFAAMAYLMVVGNTVVLALGLSASSRLAKHYATRNGKAFRMLLLKLVGIGGLLGAAGVLVALVAGREILTLLYRPEYAEYHSVFVMLMVAAGIDYVATSLDYGMSAARYFRVQMPLFASLTGASALACLWLVPAAGLCGAAIALIIANVVRAGGSLVIVVHALRALRRGAEEDGRHGQK
jgi:O-antigen/teichoic acid export membrane protein